MSISEQGQVTAADINRKHVWLQNALRNGVDELAEADEKVILATERLLKAGVKARQAAREAARQRGDKPPTVGELDDITADATEAERLGLDMTKHALWVLKERQKALHSQVDSVEAMGHNLRAEMRLSGAA